MGYSPGFLLKNGQFRTLENSPQIDTNSLDSKYNRICEHRRGVSESLERFHALTHSAIFKSMGYSPGFLLKNGQFRTFENSPQIDTNSLDSKYNRICEHRRGVSESLERFHALTHSAIFKSMGYSPGFLLKNGQFRTFENSPQIDTNSLDSKYNRICEHRGGVSESLARFPARTKIRHFKNHGL